MFNKAVGTQNFKNNKTNKRRNVSSHAKTQTRQTENNVPHRLDTKVQEEDSERPHRRNTEKSDNGQDQRARHRDDSSSVMPDHIHLIVSAPPSISPSELVKHLKGHTARRLDEEYPWLRRRSHIWARGYWVSTLGDVSIKKALNYVLSQKETESFK